jgi:hypothetical protein
MKLYPFLNPNGLYNFLARDLMEVRGAMLELALEFSISICITKGLLRDMVANPSYISAQYEALHKVCFKYETIPPLLGASKPNLV